MFGLTLRRNTAIFRTLMIIRSFFRNIFIKPLLIPKQLYDFFAHDARYIWFDWIYFPLGLWLTGELMADLVLLQGQGKYIAGRLLMFAFSFMFLGAISAVIKHISLTYPWLAWVGWMPSMSFAGDPFMTWRQVVTHDGTTHLRGTQVIDGQKLGKAKRRKELASNIYLGGMPIDYSNEAEHFLIAGKTGSGKSQAINAILRTVRDRGQIENAVQVAIIADPAGGYFQRFGQEGETLLNPFDERTSRWSPFAEIEADYDCQRIAKAAIPDGAGESREWHFYAQTLLGEILKAQWKLRNYSIKELLRLVMSASTKDLATLLDDTAAATLTHKGNEKMLSNTRAIASTYLNVWSYLGDKGDFSIRQYVRSAADGGNNGWLYLTYQDAQMAMLRTLVAMWLELAIVECLSLSENPNRRIFFVMDELDSLGRVSSLRAGLTKLRKYGGVCINGLQTIAQLRDTYGKEEAQTLLSCMSTKLLLAAGDGETAEYFSKEIGDRQFNRAKVSRGTTDDGGSSETHSTDIVTERAVLPSEITGLPNLQGFLKPVGSPVVRVNLDYVPMENLNAAFEQKRA